MSYVRTCRLQAAALRLTGDAPPALVDLAFECGFESQEAFTRAFRQRHGVPPRSIFRDFHLADWFTLGNAVCGVGALFSMMSYLQTSDRMHIYFSCALVVAALVFDHCWPHCTMAAESVYDGS